MDNDKRRGLFQLGIETGGTKPIVSWERSALLTGDTLTDGRVVSTCKAYDINHDGHIAAVIDADARYSEDHYGAGLYVETDRQGFEPVLIAGQEFAGGDAKSSGIFGDVSFIDDNIIANAHHLPANSSRSSAKSSLIHIPDASLINSNILTSSGDMITGTDHNISAFGLLDHNSNGDFTAGIAASYSAFSATVNETQSHFNITGNINYPNDTQLMTAPDGASTDAVTVNGEGGYGSRVGPSGEIFSLLDVDDQMNLIQDNQIILSTGTTSDNGKVLAITTGAAGSDGLFYYAAVTETDGQAAMTLFVYDGIEHIPLLSSGDILSDGGAPVEQILFGTTTKHVDNQNRLVFFCSFADGTSSLVLGLPS